MNKILVVDDLGFIRHRVVSLLSKHQISVVTAEDGRSGLNLLRQDALIDLVLTDGPMRGLSGLELMRACQTLERHNDSGEVPPPRVVLMVTPGTVTSNVVNDCYHPERAVSYGFAAVLVKPFSEADLLKCVRTFQSAPPVKEAKPSAAAPAATTVAAATNPTDSPPAPPAATETASSPSSDKPSPEMQQTFGSLRKLVEQQLEILNSVTK